jgi:hypothetical protein
VLIKRHRIEERAVEQEREDKIKSYAIMQVSTIGKQTSFHWGILEPI